MRTSIATVCLSGSLTDKLRAAASAGFDGVELFEPDLVAAAESPEEVRALAARLGLSLDLYQPMRDVEGVDDGEFERVLRRAEAKFALMARLGIDTVLCCSNVGTATIDDDAVSAGQLARLGDLAAGYGVRIAYEALAWGRFVDDYRRAWRIVELADRDNVGVCLDSFHILSRGHDPASITDIPGEKIFFVQLADAPALSMDVLSWSRHHRLFPGEGSFDLARFVALVARAGYTGPLSLEVFNDTYRQTDAERTARQALRSLRHVEDAAQRVERSAVLTGLAAVQEPDGVDFVEIKTPSPGEIEDLLRTVGFTARGRHRTKSVTYFSAGDVRVMINEQEAHGRAAHLAALSFHVDDASAVTTRAASLGLARAHRRSFSGEVDLPAVIAPDGLEVYWSDGAGPAWEGEFEHGDQPRAAGLRAIDHVSLTEPWHAIDEAVLLYRSLFGLVLDSTTDVASPRGLVRSRVLRSPRGGVRLPLNIAPPVVEATGAGALAQHVAFTVDDMFAFVADARGRGLRTLAIGDNYYEDVAARFDLDDVFVERLREHHLVYDRDESGEYLQCYTHTIGEVFFEFVERRDGYDGFGAGNAPVRLSAQSAPSSRG